MFICITDFAPPSKKSLNFHDDKKAVTNGVTVNNVCTNKATEQTKSKKRDCDEMFLPLSDDEDEDACGQDEVTSVAPGLLLATDSNDVTCMARF